MEEDRSDLGHYFEQRDKLIQFLLELPAKSKVSQIQRIALKESINNIRDLWEVNQELSETKWLEIRKIIDVIRKIDSINGLLLYSSFNLLKQYSERVFKTLSEREHYTTYPTVDGCIDTPALERFREDVAKDLHKAHGTPLLLKDLERHYLINGENIGAQLIKLENSWHKLRIVLEHADRVCGLDRNTTKRLYDAVASIQDQLDGLLLNDSSDEIYARRELKTLVQRLLLEPMDIIQRDLLPKIVAQFSIFGFSPQHNIMKRIHELVDMRQLLISANPNEDAQKMFLLHCSAQYVINGYVMYTIYGDIADGREIAPSVLFNNHGKYERVLPTGAPSCNMTRFGYLQLLDSNDPDTISRSLAQSKPGTYLLVKNPQSSENPWALYYREQNRLQQELPIESISQLSDYLGKLPRTAKAEQFDQDQQFKLRRILAADHALHQRSEGELTIFIEQENKRLLCGHNAFVMNQSGELELTREGFDYTVDEKKLPSALTLSMEMRVQAENGILKPVVCYQKVEPLSQSLVHTPQEIKTPNTIAQQHDESLDKSKGFKK